MDAKPQHWWVGVYGSFAEAQGDCTAFERDVWLDKVAKRAEFALSGGRGGSAIAPIATTSDYALPYIAALIGESRQPLRILDFGGGMATSYLPLRAMLPPEWRIEFVVVENEAICRKGMELFAGNGELRFQTDLPAPPDIFEIAHFGSSLHYVDDWTGLLSDVVALQPEYLLFVDLPAADNIGFVTAQLFYGNRIPVRFWNFEEFSDHVRYLGYRLLLKSRYRGYYLDRNKELPTENFDDEHRLNYVTQLIFRHETNATTGV